MLSKKKSVAAAIGLAAALLAVLVAVYVKWVAPTRIALVNYPDYIAAPMLDQELHPSVRPEIVRWTEQSGEELKNYDFILFFGMGLKFTEQQEKLLDELRRRKTPLYVTASTRSETALDSLSEAQRAAVAAYLNQGGRENFRRLLNYARRELDGKMFFAAPVEPPKELERFSFFHTSDEEGFKTYGEYLEYYRGIGRYDEGNPTVCLISGNGGGDLGTVVRALEDRQLNVVGIAPGRNTVALVEAIAPDLVIYQPHGRFSMMNPDAGIELLKKLDIPLVCPIKVGAPYGEYLRDQQGMTGGMLSQSVTMPELDGGIIPFVLSALYKNERGLNVFRVIPDRLERFADLMKNLTELKRKSNAEKKIAIVYYKGPGMNALQASGLEVGDSLLNTLRHLQAAGYTTGPLPEDPAELLRRIQENAAVFGAYAEGALAEFTGRDGIELIDPAEYRAWALKSMPADLFVEVEQQYGPAPGKYMSVERDGKTYLALGRLRFGNVVLLPQSLPGYGEDSNQLIHGVKQAPPHPYIATYLWLRHGFKADALLHYGTHGSFEFLPWKQVALSSYDWPDVLIGELPHFYLYIINNIGEAQIAKRRSYATMLSHLTPPFMSSDLYGPLQELEDKLEKLELAENPLLEAEYRKAILELVKKEKIDEELQFSADFARGLLADADLEKLHHHLHELGDSKVNRGLYVIGRPYSEDELRETATLMSTDALAAKRFEQDLKAGKAEEKQRDQAVFFERCYLTPARREIDAMLRDPEAPAKLREAEAALEAQERAARRAAMQRRRGSGGGDRPAPVADTPELDATPLAAVRAREALRQSTEAELAAMLKAFAGGYLPPSPGGDPVGNPATVPTGKNLVGLDPERTPTRESYEVGRRLAEALIAEKLKSTGQYPKKVAFSLWGGEFIRSQGTNIGEIFFLLGVEPVWDSRGRVQDVRLIAEEQLNRPRIDVVVQTSGQFRGAATSRIRLIDKAVRLAAAAPSGKHGNFVRDGSLAAARSMISAGLSPEQAKTLADARIFGGVNGNFGTGITGMVQDSGRREDAGEIGEAYLRNMGAIYTEDYWGEYVPEAFRAALLNTDTVVQPRSSNSWGPLSLDHVYEFMGGINLAVKQVTGSEPDAYFNDLRTPGRPRVQDAATAIMVEARTTVLNPKFITGMMKEGPSGAGAFAEVFRNTFGWEVTKPALVKDHLWDEYKRVYVDDSLQLGVKAYFEEKNPYALQEMTAVMLEAVRKGFWTTDDATMKELAELHAELVETHRPGCSTFVCDNAPLREMIRQQLADSAAYDRAIDRTLRGPAAADRPAEELEGMVLKEEVSEKPVVAFIRENKPALLVIAGIILIAIGSITFGHYRRRHQEEI